MTDHTTPNEKNTQSAQESHTSPHGRVSRKWRIVISILLFFLAILLVIGGTILVASGGSLYYLISGLSLLLTGGLIWRGNRLAYVVWSLLLLATVVWGLFEVGLDFWQLLPRVDIWVALGLVLLLPALRKECHRGPLFGGKVLIATIAATVVVGFVSAMSSPTETHQPLARGFGAVIAKPQTSALPMSADDWPSYVSSSFGGSYSAVDQITPDNAGKLELAWEYHTKDLKGKDDPVEFTNQVTPIKIGDSLYLCTPHSIAIALDPTTGQEKWRYDPKIQPAADGFRKWEHMTCRGVAYYDANVYLSAKIGTKGPQAIAKSSCPRRIYLPTADARLIALNAETGQPCQEFGQGGQINLHTPDLGDHNPPGGYYSTSPPMVTGDVVVVGSHVSDNKSVNEASGVIRAFDVNDGHLVWNWDSANPDETAPLPPGHHYVENSPNVWAAMSADESLGMVYLPMGNQTPDQWGADRTAGAEKYSVGLVALDLVTGNVRWHYQFVHHDLWDHDLSAAPALVDLQTPQGIKPAVIASTKQGSIYVLDRRDGTPLFPINEVPVPQGALPGDWTEKTQPVSAINYEPPHLTEAAMWGMTPLDQLYCRIRFKQMRYQGQYTPPSQAETLVYPGNTGVFDWGGVAVDPERQLLITNPNAFAFTYRMVPAAEAATAEAAVSEGAGLQPNTGAPYGVEIRAFLTPWGFPCQAPPWGWVSALDLTTGKVIWKRKNGTTRDVAPLGIPLPLGLFAQGGMLTTKGGVAFLGAAQDYYLRGYDIRDGKQLFKARLPAGGQAIPMSYRAKDGRQYVVIMAGGHGSLGTKLGDSLMAYALPESAISK